MPGFFKPGNKFGKGRPFKSKNQIEPIRRRILSIVRKRIMHEKELESVTTTELLKFLSSIMPKDFISVQVPQINYISTVPRDVPLQITDSDMSSNKTETPLITEAPKAELQAREGSS